MLDELIYTEAVNIYSSRINVLCVDVSLHGERTVVDVSILLQKSFYVTKSEYIFEKMYIKLSERNRIDVS